jgi:hypothetical protein
LTEAGLAQVSHPQVLEASALSEERPTCQSAENLPGKNEKKHLRRAAHGKQLLEEDESVCMPGHKETWKEETA